VWEVKQKASREALGKVETQLRQSHKDKGKMCVQFGSIVDASREANLESLSLLNPRVLVPSHNLTLTSGVKRASLRTDSSANTAPVPKGTITVLSHEAETEALCSAKYLRSKAKSKVPQRAKSKVTMTSFPKIFSAKFAFGGKATSVASPSKANVTAKVIFKSREAKNRNLKVRGLQPGQPNT